MGSDPTNEIEKLAKKLEIRECYSFPFDSDSISCSFYGTRSRSSFTKTDIKLHGTYLATTDGVLFSYLVFRDGPKPTLSESCNLEPCFNDYMWVPKGMTPCSRSCSGGTQETHLICAHKTTNITQPDGYCIHSHKLPIERKLCNEIPCPQSWRIGDFGECSRTCGGGLMSREVKCIQPIDVSLDKVLNLPDIMCEQPAPPSSRDCNTQPCPANWASGHWSQCSVSCGVGIELRPVVCQRITQDGDPIDVDEYHCPPTEKPEAERVCNISACPELKIQEKKIKFFQINKMDKVRIFVGGEAGILPGTSITILCPVKGKDKKRVQWLKNDKPIRQRAHVTISNRGNLKIRKSRPEKDAGKYTCLIENKKSSAQIVFLDIYNVFQESVLREKYLIGFMEEDQKVNESVTYTDPLDKKARPLQLVVSNWSSCSATCGVGFKKRNISCEIITLYYFEAFPLKICKTLGIQIPKTTETCNLKPCTKWAVNQWEVCFDDKCIKKGYANQTRTVTCVRETNSSKVPDIYCNQSIKPPSSMECRNPSCQPVWTVSEWSECLANCGEAGFQTRMLACVWESDGQPAGRNCEDLKRPLLTRQCFNNCTHEFLMKQRVLWTGVSLLLRLYHWSLS
ncbi:Protein madd-4 [Bulinus truncatus]|nr:Protein madd-4 [Bulinus truncatus]